MNSEWPDMDREMLDARIYDKLSEFARRTRELIEQLPTDPDITDKLADLADEYTVELLRIFDESTRQPRD